MIELYRPIIRGYADEFHASMEDGRRKYASISDLISIKTQSRNRTLSYKNENWGNNSFINNRYNSHKDSSTILKCYGVTTPYKIRPTVIFNSNKSTMQLAIAFNGLLKNKDMS
jgi:hypothetical protein